jgi:hypothetical protein
MKTIYFLLIGATLGMNTVAAYGQLPAASIQKKYGNETYNIYDNSDSPEWRSISIVNSRDTLYTMNFRKYCKCDLMRTDPDPLSIIHEIMKSVFPNEKRKALAIPGRRLICYTLCFDAVTGQILSVQFGLRNVTLSEEEESLTAVTLKEIYQLETLLKAQRLRTDCDCSKTQFKFGSASFTMPLCVMREPFD